MQPEKWHREYAEEILSEIRAALDEPNEAMIDAAEAFKASGGQGYTGILRAMLAASPLGGAE
ncbi:hypothetical protein GCM10011491_30190 [Brucella endophytica]|uniref:Uncharacterized protein n=1 Tax=Brucella endophytica TaxID=1963359 RepID=A0A916WIA1_9HYPH|nr:hypothetical protein GCM10011491_30190 [Brucella endophytica]